MGRKHVRNELEDFLRVELSVFQIEVSVANLAQIDQVLYERLNEAELAHHDIVVVLGLCQTFAGGSAGNQDAHDLLKEVDHAEKGRTHLVTNHRRETFRLLLLQVLFVPLQA